MQKIGISAKKLDFSKKPGFQGHFSWISSWAPTGGWNCKKVGFQTPVKTSFFARNPYFLHEIQVFCKTRWQKTWISGCTQWAPTEIQVFCPWAAEIQDFCWNPAFLHQIQLFCKLDEEASEYEFWKFAYSSFTVLYDCKVFAFALFPFCNHSTHSTISYPVKLIRCQ